MVETSVKTFALQDAAILAEIGQRFYVKRVADKAPYPYAVLRSTDDDQKYTFSGPGGHIPLFQIEVFDTEQDDCEALAELFFTRFAGHRGVMGDVVIGYCFAEKKLGEWSPDGRHYRRILELRIGTNDR